MAVGVITELPCIRSGLRYYPIMVRRFLLAATLLILLIIAACGAPSVPVTAAVQRQPLPERAAAAVVIVRLHDSDMPPYPANVYESCGGVAVGPRSILTSAHCVVHEGVALETVLFRDRDLYRLGRGMYAATVRWADLERDVAVLRTTDHVFAVYATPRPVSVADMTVEVVRHFTVAVADSPLPGQLELPIVKGDSGSPVFGLDGAVIGVVRACRFRPFVSPDCVPELGGTYAPVMP